LDKKERNRTKIVIEKFIKMNLDALLITDIKNIRYLTNFTGSSGFLLLTEERSTLVTDFRYKTQAEEEVIGFELRIENEKLPDVVAKLTEELDLKNLGFEAQALSFDLYRKISERLTGIELKPTTDLIEGLRILKEEKEIISIRTAIAMAEESFNSIQEFLRPGIIEKDIAIALEHELRKRGSDSIPFDIIVASGKRAALPHAASSQKPLEEGDLVIVDWGAEADGYHSDISRTFLLRDKDDSEKEKVYNVVLNAQREAIENIRPGMTFSGLDAIARDFIRDAGYGEYFGHSLGHGIGLSVHETPRISWQEEGFIETGMVFTVEPGVYKPDLGGIRIEDIVLVTDGEAEVLTHLPKDLVII
jgi:Xaa-Pro aminopeptidase